MSPSKKSNTGTELDLALLNVLQFSPRAEWHEVSQALGVTPATAARRWKSLQRRGLAWAGVTVGYHRAEEISSAFALVTCAADPDAVAARLAAEREVATIARTAGRYDLLLDILVQDLETLRSYLADRLANVEGVGSVVSFPITTVFTAGSLWRVRALDAQQVRRLSGGALPDAHRRTRPIDDLDRHLIAALAEDARISWSELAAACETSAPTARRRVQRLLDSGTLEFRCELATPLVGPAVQVTFSIQVPATAVPAVGRLLASMPECRLAAAVVDRSNLVATMWFASAARIDPFERYLLATFPELTVNERIVHLAAVKRIGHLLDRRDRATGTVIPLAAW